MIQEFKDKRTEAVFDGWAPKGFLADLLVVARRKLRMLDAAATLEDLRIPPANRLEALKGDRKGNIRSASTISFGSVSAGDGMGRTLSRSRTTIERRGKTVKRDEAMIDRGTPDALLPMHPGEVLREEFMRPHGMSAGMVAKACRVPRTRIERIAREEIGVSADTALRLEKLFGASATFWLNLQTRFDVEAARSAIGAEIETIAQVAA